MNNKRGENFFFVMGLILLATVVGGFGSSALRMPGGPSSISTLLHVHGAVFLAWFVLFCVQARLIGNANLRLHRTLGQASAGLAVAMVVLAYFVVQAAYQNPHFSIAGLTPAGSVMFPFTDVVNFVTVFSLALLHRRNAAVHKRFMLLAGILIIDPAAVRVMMAVGAPPPAALIPELFLFVALFAYDVITRRRPSWASVFGFGLFAAAMAAKITIAPLPAWASFVDRLFG